MYARINVLMRALLAVYTSERVSRPAFLSRLTLTAALIRAPEFIASLFRLRYYSPSPHCLEQTWSIFVGRVDAIKV